MKNLIDSSAESLRRLRQNDRIFSAGVGVRQAPAPIRYSAGSGTGTLNPLETHEALQILHENPCDAYFRMTEEV